MLLLNFSPFPLLQTPRLSLNRITRDQTEALFEMRSDKNVMKYIDRPLAKKPEEALALITLIEEMLTKNEAIIWGIFEQNNPGTLAGTIGFWRIQREHYRAEIGYLLHPSLQGRGIMQEAIAAVLDYGFRQMGLHSVEANVNPENSASIRLLERNGFVREAHFKENYFYNGRFLDSVIYSLLTPLKNANEQSA